MMSNFAKDVMSERKVFGVADYIDTSALVKIDTNISALRDAGADIKNQESTFILTSQSTSLIGTF